MPSGSHAGGGSSHSSGGGSVGGGSFGGGMNHGSRFYGPGMVIINRRPYRMSGAASFGYFLCLILSFVLIFVGVFGIANFTSGKNQIELAKKDYAYYADMIAFAKSKREQGDSSYITTVKVDHIEYHSACGKWFLVYYLPLPHSTAFDSRLRGWTYDLYTREEAAAMRGKDIEIALEKPLSEIDQETDSVPLSMPLDLSRDGDYILAKSSRTAGIIMMVCGFGGFAVLIVLSFVIKKKFAKPQESSASGNQTASEQAEYCHYCGTKLKKDDTFCPSCGAGRQKPTD